MKKILLSLVALLTLFTGNVYSTEEAAYTLTPAVGTNNSYAGNCDVTISDIKWNVTGNATLTPWRIGGKSLTGVDRTIYSKVAIADNISSVVVTNGTASSITVNSFTLTVASDADFSKVVSTVTGTFKASGTTTFTRPDGADWTGCYYKFTYNVTVSGTSNKYVEFSSAVFNKTNDSQCSAPELTAGGVFTTKPYEVTITNKESGSTVYYTTDGNDPTTSSESFSDATKTLSISETTTVKAMSVLSGKENSSVTSATYTYEESIANTAETAYTVAKIKDIIDAGSTQLKTTEIYVKGKVSQVDSYNSTYGSITYWISDDGATTSQQFEVYGGLSFEGAKFTTISEIQVGDEVIVKGYATFYASKSIYEFNTNSTLIYRTEHTKKSPTLTATYKTTMNVGETDDVVVTYDGDGAVSISSSNPGVADEDDAEGNTHHIGAYAEGTTTITISAPETDNYYAASLTYTLNVVTPIGGLETFTNGGFETWSTTSLATGWKSSTSASNATVSQSTDARTGSYSAQVTGVTSSNKRLASKEFKLPAGYYTFEVYVKPATAADSIMVAAGYVPDTLNTKGTYDAVSSSYNYGEYASFNGSEWVKISKTFQLKEESVINLVVMNNKKYGNNALVDDAVLREATAEEIDLMTSVATFEYTPEAMAENSVYYFEGDTPSVTWKSGNRFTFSTYTDDYGAYGKYYYSFAISNKTTTDGKLSDFALESACGGAKNGNNYAVWYNNWHGDSIVLDKPGLITGVYVTNTTSVVDAILNGDGMSTVSGGFQNGDLFTVSFHGYKDGLPISVVTYYLAKAENDTIFYTKDWKWVDLSELGTVDCIKVKMNSTKGNSYGPTTPMYFCLDDLGGTKPVEDSKYAIAPVIAITGINNVNANANANANANSGKFFQNGRLVIFKGGKQYNAAGQQVK